MELFGCGRLVTRFAMADAPAVASNSQSERKDASEPVTQARTLEEGLEAAGKYEGDPLDCPCIQHMKEGKSVNRNGLLHRV
jgi:hypothetical protein